MIDLGMLGLSLAFVFGFVASVMLGGVAVMMFAALVAMTNRVLTGKDDGDEA